MVRRGVLVLACASLLACEPERTGWTGYVEGEFVRVAAPVAGRLLELGVARGATITAGAPLYALEHVREQAAVSEDEEAIGVVRAQSEQAAADFRLADANLLRLTELRRKGLASEEQVDAARTEHQRAEARRRELLAQQRSAAARLEQSRWALAQKAVAAPVGGLVEDTLYRVGEWVPAGAPVVSLLPPANRLVRFFVPETEIGAVRPGHRVAVRCDGCAGAIPAVVSYVAPSAEYTPPVIYSRESRAKLVFLVEARPSPADALALHPGQPVDVEPAP